jgi:hypothetical protein
MERDLVDPAVQEACALAAQALSDRPSGLVTDLDGTISPIASAPEDAYVLPGCRRFEALSRRLDGCRSPDGRGRGQRLPARGPSTSATTVRSWSGGAAERGHSP